VNKAQALLDALNAASNGLMKVRNGNGHVGVQK